MFRKLAAISLIVLSVTAYEPTPANAGVTFATEITQLLNHVQLIMSYVRQGEQLAHEFAIMQEEAKQGVVLNQQFFGTITRDLGTLANVVQGGQALAYSMANLNSQFQQRFPGYQAPRNWSQQYQTWSQTSMDTTYSTLKALGVQSNQLNNTQTLLSKLRQMAMGTTQRNAVLQVGNQISEQQVEQLMALRQLMLADMQSKQAFQAAQVQQSQAAQAAKDQFFRGPALDFSSSKTF
jgi:type IV secretion system protein TrbJ